MQDHLTKGAFGLLFAFITFLGSMLYTANNDIVKLNQAMRLLVDDHMQIIPSPENALERGRLESRIKVNVVILEKLEDRTRDLQEEIRKLETKLEILKYGK